MKRCPLIVAVVILMVVRPSIAPGQQPAADTILTNGKIVTVDDRFTIAQAMAIRGDRIVAVGR